MIHDIDKFNTTLEHFENLFATFFLLKTSAEKLAT